MSRSLRSLASNNVELFFFHFHFVSASRGLHGSAIADSMFSYRQTAISSKEIRLQEVEKEKETEEQRRRRLEKKHECDRKRREYENKTLGRARDPRANGAWLSKRTE